MLVFKQIFVINLLVAVFGISSVYAQTVSLRPTGVNQYKGDRVAHPDMSGAMIRQTECCSMKDSDGNYYRYSVRTEVTKVADGDGEKKIYHYYFEYHVRKNGMDGVTNQIGYWNSEQGDPVEWKPKSIQLSESGVPYAVAYKEDETGLFTKRTLVLLRFADVHKVLFEGHAVKFSEARLLLHDNDEPIVFGRKGRKLSVVYQGKLETLIARSNYDWSVARDAQGTVYLLGYNFSDRSFYVQFASGDLSEWNLRMIDSAEAGWQHSLAMWENKLVVAYYYYRNAFNKGLRVATIDNGEIVNRTFERIRNGNAGWKPWLTVNREGKVDLRYLGNVREKKSVSYSFDSVDKLFEKEEPEYAGAWEDDYRNWLIVAGADTAFQWWHVWAPGPWNSDAIDADYDYKPGLLLTAFSEARIGSMNLGLSYTANLLGDVIESSAGVGARRAYEVLNGFVGWDELLWGHDVRIGVSRAQLKGVYTDEQTGDVRSLDSDLYEFDFGLLNQKRIRYGATFRYYDLVQPIYVYYAPSGSESYSYSSSATVDSSVYRAALYVNYSMLDYLSKYETEYTGFDVEGTFAAGVGLSTWGSDSGAGNGASSTLQPAGRLAVKLSYLIYKRFYAMHGAGLFFKAGYRFQADAHGFTAGTPGDRDEDDVSSDDYDVRAVHYQFEQGPFLNFGLVY